MVALGNRQRGYLGPGVKKLSSLLYTYNNNFFKKPNKKMYNRAEELYCDATIFVFDSLLSPCAKKMETEKWPKAADSPLY